MRVIHVTSIITGGAGRAVLRLHQNLEELGVDSHLFVLDKVSSTSPSIHGASGLFGGLFAHYMKNIDKLPNKFYRCRKTAGWSNNWAPNQTLRDVLGLKPDLVHMHYVGAGAFPIRAFPRLGSPIVWTLHDMMAFTGGCHYVGDCVRFRERCGKCPVLNSGSIRDLSNANWKRKQTSWKGLKMTLICPSNWMAEQSRQSALVKDKSTVVIPNGIDIRCFSPRDRKLARAALRLPANKFLIAFGAGALSDPRKGLRELQQAVTILEARVGKGHCEMIVFGSGVWDGPPFSVPIHNFGLVNNDQKLAQIYGSANVFCAPSREENLATTALEALACGAPVVSFKIGGFPDIIDHLGCGFLATPFDLESLADGLHFVFSRDAEGDSLRVAARTQAERHFDGRVIAARHLELYESLTCEAFTTANSR
jgi:glycosyltransferase involved in cell wall biosynthesis